MHTFKNHMMKKVWKKRIQIQMICFLSFFWVRVEVEDNFASFPFAPQKFPRWGLESGLFEVGLIAVFAEEGPKKGVDLLNGLLLVGLQSGGGGEWYPPGG